MTIIDDACLQKFREAPFCEYCLTPNRGQIHPHHYLARGMGGGGQLDVRENLCSVCSDCHTRVHTGEIPRHVILALIAVRMKAWPDEIETMLYRLLRTPKET